MTKITPARVHDEAIYPQREPIEVQHTPRCWPYTYCFVFVPLVPSWNLCENPRRHQVNRTFQHPEESHLQMDPSSPPFAYVAPSGHVGIVVHEAVAWHKARPAPEGEVRFSKASMITSFTFHLEGMPQYKGKMIMR